MDADNRSPLEILRTPIQYLKGVGPRRAEMLARMGLRTAVDLLFLFPRSHEDLTKRRAIPGLEEGVLQTVRGAVLDIESRATRNGGSLLGVLFDCERGHLRALWFNQPHMRQKFRLGQEFLISGKPKRDGTTWQMSHPRVVSLEDRDDEDDDTPDDPFLPNYPLTEGVLQHHLRRIIRPLLETHASLLEEVFPETHLESHDLMPIAEAVRSIHFPQDQASLDRARRRFVYQELFILQLGMAMRRRQLAMEEKAPPMEVTAQIDARIMRLFPFEPTDAQRRAMKEIGHDLGRETPMTRLLQGDVGSGKTIVAIYAMLVALAYRRQAVIMAPTEILARQHEQSLRRILHPAIGEGKVRIAGLYGGMPTKERSKLLEEIASGEIDIIVGTHAVLQHDVVFHQLGLVVIDEQHKFGVRQRALLKESVGNGEGPDAQASPHYLVMTATPIPRSMTMTLLGDLDVSVIDEMPPGRQSVKTYLVPDDRRDKWWDFFSEKLREGRQGYVVVPLVEESETLDVMSLQEAYEDLANGPLEAFRVGLLHGRMTNAEKDAVMRDFRDGELQVLVSTTVVEVGVDVPNATLMAIENGERFGLAQLHQLRGRVARGRYSGICGVFSNAATDEADDRLKAFASTTDGFKLAEIDFELRGPGEILGTRQHGLPPFRVADLIQDAHILAEARRDAFAMVDQDPKMETPEHAKLRRMVLARYGRVLELGDIG